MTPILKFDPAAQALIGIENAAAAAAAPPTN
jgi:hypothetical protein